MFGKKIIYFHFIFVDAIKKVVFSKGEKCNNDIVFYFHIKFICGVLCLIYRRYIKKTYKNPDKIKKCGK